MAEDERLREALLELQMLRDREAQVLDETKTLLDCLEAYSTAKSPGEALAAIFMSLRQKIGAVLTLMVQRTEDRLEIVASDHLSLVGRPLDAPVDPFARPRNVSNLSMLGAWGPPMDMATLGGVIIAPVNETMALLSFRAQKEGFRRQDMDLVQRLSGLAAQALVNRATAAEKDLLAATISGSSSGFAISDATDPAQPLVYVNKAFETLSGYAADEVLGQNCRFLTAEDPDAPERTRLRKAVADRSGGKFLLRNRRKSGELFWNELTLYPVRDAFGAVRNMVATQADVTARVEAADERDIVRARMERALAATEDAFLVLEADGSVAFANAAVPILFPAPGANWEAGSSFSDNWKSYLADCADLPGRVTQLLREPDIEALAELPSGQEVDLPDGRSVLLRAGRLEDGGLVVSATDITAMKSAQHLLSQRLAAIEAAPDGIAITDEAGRMIYLNSAAAGLLGFERATQCLGKRWQKRYLNAPTPSKGAGFEATLDREGTEVSHTHEITGSPLEGGGAILVIRDVTEALAIEAREADMMRELSRLQRQEAIAQLTAGVAHDFNNLLSAINGSATLIGLSAGLPDSAKPHLDRILAAGRQSSKLISRLLDIGTSSDTEGVFDLASVLKALPDLLGTNLPPSIPLSTETETATLVLQGVSGTLNQILVNLILNSKDAIGDAQGAIAVRASEVLGSEAPDIAFGNLDPAAKYARIDVTDTGGGMTEEVSSNAFKPFFTTKGRLGTGLGLANAALQVQALGGAMAIKSTVGVGTTLSIFWPTAQPGFSKAALEAGEAIDLEGLTVIVVDDDPNVAAVIAHYLEAQRVEVAVCEDPRDAVEAIAEDPAAWSALITDYDMPVMNGGALTEAVKTHAPDLPVFVVTALAKRLSDPRLNEGRVAGIFAKPVDLDVLSRALAAAANKR
jgi:two-component system cell cycle sensor histidine kinase/response regulator CckA